VGHLVEFQESVLVGAVVIQRIKKIGDQGALCLLKELQVQKKQLCL